MSIRQTSSQPRPGAGTAPGDSPRRGFPALPVVWTTLLALAYLVHVVFLNCVTEDAFITFRFARHVADGHGFVWNIGEPPVEGYTGFLWLLASAAAAKAGLDLPRTAQVLGTLAGGATLLLAYLAGRRLCGWPPRIALIPVIMLTAAGPFATWSASGMETVPFTLLAFAGTCAFAAYWQSADKGAERRAGGATAGGSWLSWMSVLLVLASLTRPEGVMVFGLLFGLSVLFAAGDLRAHARAHATALGVYVVLFGAYFAWRWSYFGDFLPNTYYAKTGGGIYQVARGALLAVYFAFQFVTPLVPWILVAAWEASGRALPPRPLGRTLAVLRQHALLSAAAVICVVYSAYVVAVGGDYMAMHRFFVPILPAMYLLGAACLDSLVPPGGLAPRRWAAVAVLVTVAVLATLVQSTRAEKQLFVKPSQQHGNFQGVKIERWHVARLSLIGRFFREHRRSADESVATSAIGAIGYYSDMKVLDFHGLVDRHIARTPVPDIKRMGRAGHQKSDFPYLIGKAPTYVMLIRELTPEPVDLRRFSPPGVWELVEKDYEPRSVWLTDTVNGEAGYFTYLERRAAAPR